MNRATAGSSLRIIIDGSMARGGGGFTYLVNVIPELVRLAPQHRFLLLSGNPSIEDSLPDAPNLEVRSTTAGGASQRIRSILFDGPRLAREWNADLFFSVTEYGPLLGKTPTIVAFRNRAVFESIEGGWNLRQTLRLFLIRTLAAVTARAASRIIFVSHDSAEYIGERLSIPVDRRSVVHHGIDRLVWSSAVERPTKIDRYILSVSSIYRYKNFIPLIQGWAELSARRPETPDLVIIGDDQDPEYSTKMEAARAACGDLADRVHIVGEVPYEQVKGWYQHADLFVFPSYLETFGHPLLEAMTCEVPLVASDIPVFREIAGGAALYAKHTDPSAFADRMESALFDDSARGGLILAGRERIKEFSWQRTAEKLLAEFERTASS